jgi:hypothetical protein
MADSIQPLLADMLVSGMAFLALALMGYLCWLRFREKRQQRKLQQERERNRRNHWGYV